VQEHVLIVATFVAALGRELIVTVAVIMPPNIGWVSKLQVILVAEKEGELQVALLEIEIDWVAPKKPKPLTVTPLVAATASLALVMTGSAMTVSDCGLSEKE